MAVLRGWGVAGDDGALRTAAAQVGYHALSVAVLGSYLRSFADGRVEAVKDFDLDAVTGEDPRGGQARARARLLRGASARPRSGSCSPACPCSPAA